MSVNQLAVTIGIVASYLIDYALAHSHNWRLMFLLAVIPGTALVVGMWRMPFSPRWLMTRGRADDARKDLQKIRAAMSGWLCAWPARDVEGGGPSLTSSPPTSSARWWSASVWRCCSRLPA